MKTNKKESTSIIQSTILQPSWYSRRNFWFLRKTIGSFGDQLQGKLSIQIQTLVK